MVECPLWVISRHFAMQSPCPLCSRKRTCAVQLGMSALGQKRTLLCTDTVVGSFGAQSYCALFLVSWAFCWSSFSSAAFRGASLTVSLSILPVKRNGGW